MECGVRVNCLRAGEALFAPASGKLRVLMKLLEPITKVDSESYLRVGTHTVLPDKATLWNMRVGGAFRKQKAGGGVGCV